MRRNRMWVTCVLFAGALGESAFLVTPKRNPPVDPARSMEAVLAPPPAVARMLDRACADCHSNRTRWPWYSKMPPMSFLVSRDVARGRKAMNFSEWTDRKGEMKPSAAGNLLAACEEVQAGRMPLPRYGVLHPESRLTPADAKLLCRWTAEVFQELYVAGGKPHVGPKTSELSAARKKSNGS